MKIIGVIPARYQSSRFPGKPLADICGKPMLWWVYQQAQKVEELDEVYVATDDTRILTAVEAFGGNAVMTSDKHLTGSDRVAEVAEMFAADLYVSIQGDEPLIEPKNISIAIQAMKNNAIASGVILKTQLKNPVDVVNATTAKVVCDSKGFALLVSRSPIPYPQGTLDFNYYKTLGIYIYTKDALRIYKNIQKGSIELAEDAEIMRLIEYGERVFVQEVQSETIGVDSKKDLERVKSLISLKSL
jgi:3-deoxy-manno-octulosonate cytidylyltransferase (CMP-KDO synthetase)